MKSIVAMVWYLPTVRPHPQAFGPFSSISEAVSALQSMGTTMAPTRGLFRVHLGEVYDFVVPVDRDRFSPRQVSFVEMQLPSSIYR